MATPKCVRTTTASDERRSTKRANAARVAAVKLESPDALLLLDEVLALYPVSPSSWWAGIRDGRYPSGVRLGARRTAWTAASIRTLLASTKAAQS